MSSRPLVSVLLPVFNGEHYVADAISSITNQTYSNLELIVINDGSSDRTLSIVTKLAQKDRRIRVFSHSNRGLTRSLNLALQYSKGLFIARQDADDLSMPTRLEKQHHHLSLGTSVFSATRVICMPSRVAKPRYPLFHLSRYVSLLSNPFFHGTLMFSRKALMQLNGYNTSYRYAQDYDLISRAFMAGMRCKYINVPLYIFNQRPDSVSSLHANEQRKTADIIRRAYRSHFFSAFLL